MITERNEGESIADWIDRANNNCCGCGWVGPIISAVAELEAIVANRVSLETTSAELDKPREDAFFVPDESGMAGHWSWPGHIFQDFDAGGDWYVRVDQFLARRATDAEVAAAKKTPDGLTLARG